VTLDISMPGRSGLEFLKQLVAQQADTGVVMLTAHGDAQTAVQALTLGAWDYLTKPVIREELVFHVEKVLERQQLRAEKRHLNRLLESRTREEAENLRLAYEEVVQRLRSVSSYGSKETRGHVERVGLGSEVLARAAKWSPDRAELLRAAAALHDVGNIGIPDAVLYKPERLTAAEVAAMQKHTLIGARILADSRVPLLRMAQKVALSHHERWDGTGYPEGLTGSDIPEVARTVALVDVYDALTHDRAYRTAMSHEEAQKVIEGGAGTHFDPVLTELFLAVLPAICRIASQKPDEPSTAAVAPELSSAQGSLNTASALAAASVSL
jgi:putative two-component system response regulator